MDLLSTQEVAKVLGIHESTVRLWAAKGNMPFKAIKSASCGNSKKQTLCSIAMVLTMTQTK